MRVEEEKGQPFPPDSIYVSNTQHLKIPPKVHSYHATCEHCGENNKYYVLVPREDTTCCCSEEKCH